MSDPLFARLEISPIEFDGLIIGGGRIILQAGACIGQGDWLTIWTAGERSAEFQVLRVEIDARGLIVWLYPSQWRIERATEPMSPPLRFADGSEVPPFSTLE